MSTLKCHFDLWEKSAEIMRFLIFVPQIRNDSTKLFLLGIIEGNKKGFL